MKKIQWYVDRWLNRQFNKGRYTVTKKHLDGTPREIQYERFPSVKIAVITKRKVMEMGTFQTIVYTFDERYTILTRKRLKDIFKEKGRLIKGTTEVDITYRDHTARMAHRNFVSVLYKTA